VAVGISLSEKQQILMPGYQVKLPLFEGPLDLLLFLIQRDEINIYDIPIARITEEYLKYLRLMQLLHLDMAAEFLVMAATLMSIKSQMLLPQPVSSEDLAPEDPRQELVERLVEYRLYKMAAEKLADNEDRTLLQYTRPGMPQEAEEDDREILIEASLFDLITAFEEIFEKSSKREMHHVDIDAISVKQRIDRILEIVSERHKISFTELIQSDSRILMMVVTFLALLELIRAQRVLVRQREAFGQIWIYQKKDDGQTEHPIRITS